jgi:hypothetical protein
MVGIGIADLFIGGIVHTAPHKTHRGGFDTGYLTEDILGPPEAAAGKCRKGVLRVGLRPFFFRFAAGGLIRFVGHGGLPI